MRPRGAYKLTRRSGPDPSVLDPFGFASSRASRIVDSLRAQILEGGENLRIRQVFAEPRAIYRIELEVPDLSCQRTTLLDGDALEELLEFDDVRRRVAKAFG